MTAIFTARERTPRGLFLWLGRRADLIGWLLLAWPFAFLVWQERVVERGRSLGPFEVAAYVSSAFALPLTGLLIKRLTLSRLRLAAAGDNLRNILDHMADVLVIIDREGKIVFGNTTFERHFGRAVGRPCREVLRGEEGCDSACPGLECLEGTEERRTRRRLAFASGESRWFEIIATPFRSGQGEITGVIEIWRDISPQVLMEERLREEASTDSLTGLRNHRSLFQTLPLELQRSFRQRYPLSMIFFDIDGFKRYNDRLGHPAGDHVLQRLGRIISDHIRTGVDSGYRYGGDEFCALLPHLGAEDARGVAERILASFLREGFPEVSLSAGVLPAREGVTASALVAEADQAMYEAKKAGGGRVFALRS